MIKWGLFWYSVFALSGMSVGDIQNTWRKGTAYSKRGWLDDSKQNSVL